MRHAFIISGADLLMLGQTRQLVKQTVTILIQRNLSPYCTRTEGVVTQLMRGGGFSPSLIWSNRTICLV